MTGDRYLKNIAAFHLEQQLNFIKPDTRIKIEITPSHWATLLYEAGGKHYPLHSLYNPREEANRWAQSQDDETELFVMLGFGLGYYAEALLNNKERAEILAVEVVGGVLQAALSLRDLHHLAANPRFYLLAGEGEEVLNKVDYIINQSLYKKIEILPMPSYRFIIPEKIKWLQEQLRQKFIQRTVNLATIESFSFTWLDNYTENFLSSLGDNNISSLKNKFTGVPAILVSAGPSLTKSITTLQLAKGKALIVCNGSAVKIFERYGLKPDLLVSVDGDAANYQHFKNLVTEDLILAYPPTIYPRIVSEFKGRRYVITLDTFPFVQWMDYLCDRQTINIRSGPSVANTALDIVYQMGCNPIIFVGQDLAYTGGFTHAEGATHREEIPQENRDSFLQVKGINGDTVLTSRSLCSMKTWFEQYIRNKAQESRFFINASAAGAHIEGTHVMPLTDALAKWCREDIDLKLLKKDTKECKEEKNLSPERFYPVLTQLQLARKDLGRIMTLCKEELDKKIAATGESTRVTWEEFETTAKYFQAIDKKITGMPVFQYFMLPEISHVLETINSFLVPKVNEEKGLQEKLKLLVDTYALFSRALVAYGAHLKTNLNKMVDDLEGYIRALERKEEKPDE
ncbi:6-hydroxymethylpterin diphosphokinase MptE-like protein [Moorella naiadis]|uniref:motility associated factor glycosyltransferase family protein n=1 Tax=Moorella naiadis (nom. illeg.) TaxID=3093670 RepID=UPI003D9CBC9F